MTDLISIKFDVLRDVYFSRIIGNFELRDEVSNLRVCLAKQVKAIGWDAEYLQACSA